MIKSIIRGFGSQLGRTAANEVINNKRMSFGKMILNLFFGVLIGIGVLIGLAYWGSTTDAYKQSQSEYLLKQKKDSIENTKLQNIEYYKGHVVHIGKNGGKYYLTKSGKKRYI
jgi:predicted negative regulator of RcsB-dependent stress response